MKYILCEYVNKKKYNAGNKARCDVIEIAESYGYKHIPLYKSGSNYIIIFLQILSGCFRIIFKAKRNDIILIQYPYYPMFVDRALFSLLNIGKKIKKYTMCVLIHDVISLRSKEFSSSSGPQLLKNELELLKPFDYIICHNEKMYEKFMATKPTKKYKILGLFDYLYSGEGVAPNYSQGHATIDIAGNLNKEKSGYLYELPKLTNVTFFLYGDGYNGPINEFIQYKGTYSPDDLIDHLEGNFGLVWDGENCTTCSGVYGQYLKFNNPHKFSLYIAAGLPVIVWSESALADFVKEKNIGFCIDNIDQIEQKISCLTIQEYDEMIKNVMEERVKIVNGEYLLKVLKAI